MNLTQIIAALQGDVVAIKEYVKSLQDANAAKDAQIADLNTQLAAAQANQTSQADLDALTQVHTDAASIVPPVQS